MRLGKSTVIRIMSGLALSLLLSANVQAKASYALQIEKADHGNNIVLATYRRYNNNSYYGYGYGHRKYHRRNYHYKKYYRYGHNKHRYYGKRYKYGRRYYTRQRSLRNY